MNEQPLRLPRTTIPTYRRMTSPPQRVRFEADARKPHNWRALITYTVMQFRDAARALGELDESMAFSMLLMAIPSMSDAEVTTLALHFAGNIKEALTEIGKA